MANILENHAFVVFMVIALSGLGVLMAYAIFSRFTNKDPPQRNANEEFSQAQYMREVRLRYQGSMANANGYGRKWMEITHGGGPGPAPPMGDGRNSEMSFV